MPDKKEKIEMKLLIASIPEKLHTKFKTTCYLNKTDIRTEVERMVTDYIKNNSNENNAN